MTLMLLDAASLYFRAFYGVKQPMPAPDGTPTNAVRGFLDMTATLLTRFRPTDLVACIDADWRPAWRVALVASYKTHRLADPAAALADVGGAPPGEAEPPGLAEQVPIILDVLAGLGVATLGAPQHQAGDVIATLARRAPRLAGVAARLDAARDYLTRAPAVVRTVRTLPLPDVDTALPRTPADLA